MTISRREFLISSETDAQVASTSVFRIGSLTKQFAGATVLELVSTGKLSLSDHAHEYLPFLSRHEPFRRVS